MLCYLLETETNGSHDGENVSRRKGKAAEWRLWWECLSCWGTWAWNCSRGK
jgi:hypothetical protein